MKSRLTTDVYSRHQDIIRYAQEMQVISKPSSEFIGDSQSSETENSMANRSVDVCFTCVTDQPPILPIKEELNSFGFETIRSKKDTSKRSVLNQCIQRLQEARSQLKSNQSFNSGSTYQRAISYDTYRETYTSQVIRKKSDRLQRRGSRQFVEHLRKERMERSWSLLKNSNTSLTVTTSFLTNPSSNQRTNNQPILTIERVGTYSESRATHNTSSGTHASPINAPIPNQEIVSSPNIITNIQQKYVVDSNFFHIHQSQSCENSNSSITTRQYHDDFAVKVVITFSSDEEDCDDQEDEVDNMIQNDTAQYHTIEHHDDENNESPQSLSSQNNKNSSTSIKRTPTYLSEYNWIDEDLIIPQSRSYDSQMKLLEKQQQQQQQDEKIEESSRGTRRSSLDSINLIYPTVSRSAVHTFFVSA